MAEAEIAGIGGEADILGVLVEHALVEHGIAPGHASLELGATADGAVHEQAEAHAPPPAYGHLPHMMGEENTKALSSIKPPPSYGGGAPNGAEGVTLSI